jgi:hypothetical protein
VKQTRKELAQRPGGAVGLDGTASWRGAPSRTRERNLNVRDVRGNALNGCGKSELIDSTDACQIVLMMPPAHRGRHPAMSWPCFSFLRSLRDGTHENNEVAKFNASPRRRQPLTHY